MKIKYLYLKLFCLTLILFGVYLTYSLQQQTTDIRTTSPDNVYKVEVYDMMDLHDKRFTHADSISSYINDNLESYIDVIKDGKPWINKFSLGLEDRYGFSINHHGCEWLSNNVLKFGSDYEDEEEYGPVEKFKVVKLDIKNTTDKEIEIVNIEIGKNRILLFNMKPKEEQKLEFKAVGYIEWFECDYNSGIRIYKNYSTGQHEKPSNDHFRVVLKEKSVELLK